MLDKTNEKRLRAVKIAKAINSIEGVSLSDKVKQISERWANGEITSEQMKKEVMIYINDYKPTSREYIEDK